MKKSLLTSVLMLASSCSQSHGYKMSTIPYDGDSGTSITVLKNDRNNNILIGRRNEVTNSTVVESIGKEGSINWRFFLERDNQDTKSTVAVADIYQTKLGRFLICTNHFNPSRKPESYSKVYELDNDGKMISSKQLDDSPDNYNSNAEVQKCWEDGERLYIIRAIFGGSRYKTNVNSKTVFWLSSENKKNQIIINNFIESSLNFLVRISAIKDFEGKLFYTATNGIDSELIKVKLENENVIAKKILGKAQLISSGKKINVLAQESQKITFYQYDESMNVINNSSTPIQNSEELLATFPSRDEKTAVITFKLNEKESEIKLFEIDGDLNSTAKNILQSWTPPAIFSKKFSSAQTGKVVLQFIRKSKSDSKKITNNIFEITSP